MADTLSRGPLSTHTANEVAKDMENFVQTVISGIPATEDYLESHQLAQSQDTVCSKLMEFCRLVSLTSDSCQVT